MAATLRMLIKGDPEPSTAQWQTLGLAHWRGDPTADAMVSWMHEQGMAKAWPLLERGMAGGLDAVPQDAAPLRAYLAEVSRMPSWLDQDKLALGAHVLQSSGLHGMRVLRDAGLMAGYQASAINQTLLMTGSLARGAQRRVAETTTWWLACTEDGGMRPGGPGYQSTLRVRLMHAMVRHQLLRNTSWDGAYLGLPVNQSDMQATYLAFSVVQLLALRTTGMLISKAQSDAVMHMWRYIGWLMGVEDGLMCDSEEQGRILLYQNVISQAPPDDSSVVLGRALMDEPLARLYSRWPQWSGRVNKARHLSLVRWFVGSEGMKNLGLPPAWPWYPLAMMLPMALSSALQWALPPLRAPWRRWARQRQVDYLPVLMGDHKAAHMGPSGGQASGHR